MRTSIDIDDDLIAEAMVALGARTKREAVEISLRRSVLAKRQLLALDELRGMGWEGDLDAMRTDKRPPEW